MTTIKSIKAFKDPNGPEAEPLTIEFSTPFIEWAKDMSTDQRRVGAEHQAAAIVRAMTNHIPSLLFDAIYHQMAAHVRSTRQEPAE